MPARFNPVQDGLRRQERVRDSWGPVGRCAGQRAVVLFTAVKAASTYCHRTVCG